MNFPLHLIPVMSPTFAYSLDPSQPPFLRMINMESIFSTTLIPLSTLFLLYFSHRKPLTSCFGSILSIAWNFCPGATSVFLMICQQFLINALTVLHLVFKRQVDSHVPSPSSSPYRNIIFFSCLLWIHHWLHQCLKTQVLQL